MRIGPHKSRALASSGSVVTAATTLPADAATASDTVQGESRPADGQLVDQEARLGVAPVRAEEQPAAAADAGTRPASGAVGESGSQPQTASAEIPTPAPKGGQAQPSTTGALPPATEGLGERCRKVDAGGKGKPTLVFAACRPAIEAEPEAADIMVMLARAEIDLGRAAEAQNWAKKALRIKRDLPDAYVFLGGAEQEMGRPAEAKAAYRKYLELAPTGRHARELRAVLNSL
jgi:tetratricopeptide (TPR) repeat protein